MFFCQAPSWKTLICIHLCVCWVHRFTNVEPMQPILLQAWERHTTTDCPVQAEGSREQRTCRDPQDLWPSGTTRGTHEMPSNPPWPPSEPASGWLMSSKPAIAKMNQTLLNLLIVVTDAPGAVRFSQSERWLWMDLSVSLGVVMAHWIRHIPLLTRV